MVLMNNRATLFGHFPAELGEFEGISGRISEALDAVIKEQQTKGSDPEIDYSIDYMLGDFPLLLRVGFEDFHLVSDIQSQLLRRGAVALSWVFASPFVLGDLCLDESSAPPDRFVIHLRVNRGVYAANGFPTQKALTNKIQEILLLSQGSIVTNLYAGLSWSDLILYGAFSCDRKEVLHFILRLRALQGAGGKPIFQKTLTAFGFACSDGRPKDSAVAGSPLIFARSKAGGFASTYGMLERLLGRLGLRDEAVIGTLDGVSDLVAIPVASRTPGSREEPLPRVHFEEVHGNVGAESTQTHLLFLDPKSVIADIEREKKRGALSLPDLEIRERIRVGESQNKIERLMPQLDLREGGHRPLPRDLRDAITNVLSLLGHTYRDKKHHSDSRPAIMACLDGLGRGLAQINESFAGYQEAGADEADERYWRQRYAEAKASITDWCNDCQRILSERRAGSFDELFREGNRFASHRGSIQKLIFITDGLANSFLREILGKCAIKVDSRLVTIHEPTPTVESDPVLGVIRIPSRIRFSIPSSLHPIWHEVGQFIFQHVIVKNSGKYMVRYMSGGKRAAADYAKDDPTFTTLFETMGDMFSDLVSFVFGFRGDFRTFLRSLVSREADHQFADRARMVSASGHWARVGRRLFFAHEFLLRWEGEVAESLDYTDLDDGDLHRVVNDVGFVAAQLSSVLSKPRYQGIDVDYFALRHELLGEVRHPDFSDIFSMLLQDALDMFPHRGAVGAAVDEELLARLKKGESVDLAGQNLNDYFLKVYEEELDSRLEATRERPKWVAFRYASALGDSAVLALYKLFFNGF